MRKNSLSITIVVFIFDQLIKYIVNKTFYYGVLKCVIPNLFYLTKVYNYGAAWSTFIGNRWFLIIVAIISFIFLLWYQNKFKNISRNYLAFGLIQGGLLGNLIDRIYLGYVIDYLKINIFSYEFPIFNLADICIVVGFCLLIIAIFRGEDKSDNKCNNW